jgi:hypothetical protein
MGWFDRPGAYGIAGPDGPSNIEMAGSRWPDLPLSSNIEDRRDNNEWFRGLMFNAGMPLPNLSLDQLKRIFTHPMTPLPRPGDGPLLPQGPLSREAGYDHIGMQPLSELASFYHKQR